MKLVCLFATSPYVSGRLSTTCWTCCRDLIPFSNESITEVQHSMLGGVWLVMVPVLSDGVEVSVQASQTGKTFSSWSWLCARGHRLLMNIVV